MSSNVDVYCPHCRETRVHHVEPSDPGTGRCSVCGNMQRVQVRR